MEQKEYLKLIENWKLEHKVEIESGKCKKVFIECLPKLKNNNISWSLCENKKVYFIYNNEEGFIVIYKYLKGKKPTLNVKYKDKELNIFTSHFTKCKLGNLLGIKSLDFKIKIGQTFKDDKRDITIIDRKIIRDAKNRKWKAYKYQCNKCGFDGNRHWSIKDKEYKDELWVTEGAILSQKQGCSCCGNANKIIVENINSIYKTNPWMIPYMGEECAKTHTYNSDELIYPICPDCKKVRKKKIAIKTIYKTHSIACSCSDGISYSEKMMFIVLDNLGLNFCTQLSKTTFKWCNKYRYDFYFEYNNEKYIIEMNGIQHYEENDNWEMSLNEVQKNDRLKKKLALSNGIKEENYIIIDCRKSDLEWIRDNNEGILNSRLNELFDLSRVDWFKVGEFALSNRVKKACELKHNNPELTTGDIGETMGYKGQTILKWIKKGSKLGWCNYNAKEEQIKNATKSHKATSKKVNIFKNKILIDTFESLNELQRESKKLFGETLWASGISKACKQEKEYKGYTFQFI